MISSVNTRGTFLFNLTLCGLLISISTATVIEISPSGTGRDHGVIQAALDGLDRGDTLLLKGDFNFEKTIYLPSDFTWILEGTIKPTDNAQFDRIGINEGNVDSRRPTAITEKPGGATGIDMSGGVYEGNMNLSGRFINFTEVTRSKFHNMVVKNTPDDNFTLGAKSTYNEVRNIVSSFAGGNALTDRGEYNKWYDCIAQDCASDGITPKCRGSEFYRCIARRNLGPGWGCYARLDGGIGNVGEKITGNKFYDIESYDNERGGFSFNISANCGPGAVIKDNFIQGVFYNNRHQGVFFRNKTSDGIVEDNHLEIIVFGNQGLNQDGSVSAYAGGLGVEADSPVSGLTGHVVSYNNNRYDVNLHNGTGMNLIVFSPDTEQQAVLYSTSPTNDVNEVDFVCPPTFDDWAVMEYCGVGVSTKDPVQKTNPLPGYNPGYIRPGEWEQQMSGTLYRIDGSKIISIPGSRLPALSIGIKGR